MAWVYYFTISQKGVPWKSWLDPRFPRNLKLKQILKWLPLDRGCFKVYFFTQREKVTQLVFSLLILMQNMHPMEVTSRKRGWNTGKSREGGGDITVAVFWVFTSLGDLIFSVSSFSREPEARVRSPSKLLLHVASLLFFLSFFALPFPVWFVGSGY